jgi:hypothetical protein
MRHLIAVLAASVLITGCQPASKVRRTLALNELQNRAGYAEQQGDEATAIELWTEYVERRPHEAMARYRLGQALMRTGDPAGASEHLWVAHDLKPGRMDYLDALAESLHQRGQSDELFQLLRDTMTEGGLAAGHIRYARYAQRAGLADEAEESLRIAAAIEGTRSDVPYRLLADLARQTGDSESEIEAWRTVLWFSPADPAANERLRELGMIPGPSLATPPQNN